MALKIMEQGMGHFTKVLAWAAKIGKLDQLLKVLEWNGTYGERRDDEFDCTTYIYPDSCSDHGFYFIRRIKVKNMWWKRHMQKKIYREYMKKYRHEPWWRNVRERLWYWRNAMKRAVEEEHYWGNGGIIFFGPYQKYTDEHGVERLRRMPHEEITAEDLDDSHGWTTNT